MVMHIVRGFGLESLVVTDLGDAPLTPFRFSKKWGVSKRDLVRCPRCKDLVPRYRIRNGRCNWC